MFSLKRFISRNGTLRNFMHRTLSSGMSLPPKDYDDCDDNNRKQRQDEDCEEQTVKCDDGDSSNGQDTITPIKRAEFPGKVRMGFIPEEWFQFFYPKTGVTGPYTFGIGLLTYLMSKEIYVMEHEYYTGLSLLIMIIWAVKKLGPATAAYADKEIDRNEADWAAMHQADMAKIKDEIENEYKEQSRAEGALMLIEAKRAMIDIQLETAYRQEVMKIYNDILQRLDYQVALGNIERRLSRKHMMFWIHDQVLKAIEGETDEQKLEKTKADISAMVIRLNDLESEDLTRQESMSKQNKPTT